MTENRTTPLLEVEDLTVTFDTDEGLLTAVDRVSFRVQPGETLGLVGESGCGKSVTAMSVVRLVPSPPGQVRSGRIRFQGQDLLELPIRELRRLRGSEISFIFQEPMTALSPLHRVGTQLVETVRLHRKMTRREAWELSRTWLHKVGIPAPEERMYAYPFELSGGMRQRVMIAMALMLEPTLIIADEPTTALDVTIQAQILDLMREMKRADASLMLITHDMGVIWEMCDRVIVMYASRIVEEGPVERLFDSPLHPYTQGLLRSMPSMAGEVDRLPAIEGRVPSLLELPEGCSFAGRCPYARDRCRHETPELRGFGDQRSACLYTEELRRSSNA